MVVQCECSARLQCSAVLASAVQCSQVGEAPRNYEGSPRISAGFLAFSMDFLGFLSRISYDFDWILLWI